MESRNTIEKLLKPSELTEILGLKRSCIYRLLRSGTIPSIAVAAGERKTHDLGLDLETKRRTQKVVIKRLTTDQGKCGHTETGVEALEAKARPPRMSPTIKI